MTVLTITAAIVLSACSGGATGETTAGGAEDTAVGSLTFTGTDAVAWEETGKSASAGPVEVTLACGDAVGHTLAIEGVQAGEAVAECEAGGSDTATVELDAGEHTYFCTVPGHREQGMEGTLSVG